MLKFSITPLVTSMRLNADRATSMIALLMMLGIGHSAIAQEIPSECGVLRSTARFGPYDYRPERYIPESVYRSQAALLNMVEHAHFTPEVEALIRGKTNTMPGGDMTYTLHSFPNHHRALMAMVALGEKEHTDKPSGVPYSINCFFIRATTFRPDDYLVRLIYASYLAKNHREKEAEGQLKLAADTKEATAFTFRNIGLIYFDMKRYDEALSFAHKAISMGLAGGPLRERLESVNRWSEPPPLDKGD